MIGILQVYKLQFDDRISKFMSFQKRFLEIFHALTILPRRLLSKHLSHDFNTLNHGWHLHYMQVFEGSHSY